jgi:hypothetical protein
MVHAATHPLGETSQYVVNDLWVFSHVIGYVAWVFCLFGLVGLYLRYFEKTGGLVLTGFVLTLVGGTTFYSAVLWLGAIVQPFLTSNAPALNDSLVSTTSSPAVLALVIGLLLFVVGYPLFGVALYRSNVMQHRAMWPAILSIVGVILFFGAVAIIVLSNIGGMVIGLSLAAWGYMTWSESRPVSVKSG